MQGFGAARVTMDRRVDGHPSDLPPLIRPRHNARAAALLAITFAALFLQWQVIDNSPQSYDQAMYLIDALDEFQASKIGGFLGFYKTFLTTNPGRLGLLPLIAQPGFWIFGPSQDAAIAPFALFCLLAVWGFYDFTYNIARHCLTLGDRQAGLAGFAAALLFVLYPATEHQSNTFLTEFPLIASMAALHAVALRYFLTGRVRWALAVGFAVTTGLMAKITFPALAIVPAGLVVWRWWLVRDWRRTAAGVFVILVPPLIIVGPFLIRNFRALIEQTRFLTSTELAGIYGFGGNSLNFLLALLHQYEFLLLNTLALVAVVYCVLAGKSSAKWVALLAAGYLVPLLIVAFSNFRLERYAYPGFTPLFCLAGLGLIAGCRGRNLPAAWLLAALVVFPAVKFATFYSFLPPQALSLVYWTWQHSSADEKYGFFKAQPAPRNDIAELVREVDKNVCPGTVILLGGATDFNPLLLRFQSRLLGADRGYTTFTLAMPEGPSGRQNMLNFINDMSPAALLYKTPPYEPELVGRLVPETLSTLIDGGEYRRVDLEVKQPNGSRFILLIPDGGSSVVMPLRYGTSYESTLPEFAMSGSQMVVEIKFRRVGLPKCSQTVPLHTIFFHVLDEAGNIILVLDGAFCQQCRFLIPPEVAARTKRIGFGLYSNTGSATDPRLVLLDASGGPTDMDGRRILVEVPANIKMDIPNQR